MRLPPSALTASLGITLLIAAIGNRKTNETHSFQYLRGLFGHAIVAHYVDKQLYDMVKATDP